MHSYLKEKYKSQPTFDEQDILSKLTKVGAHSDLPSRALTFSLLYLLTPSPMITSPRPCTLR